MFTFLKKENQFSKKKNKKQKAKKNTIVSKLVLSLQEQI